MLKNGLVRKIRAFSKKAHFKVFSKTGQNNPGFRIGRFEVFWKKAQNKAFEKRRRNKGLFTIGHFEVFVRNVQNKEASRLEEIMRCPRCRDGFLSMFQINEDFSILYRCWICNLIQKRGRLKNDVSEKY